VEGVRPYEIWFVRDGENRLVSARQFSPKEQKVRGLIIMELSTDPDTRGRMQDLITADKAEWDAERRGWNLTHRGARISVTGDMGNRLTGEESIVRTPVKFYPCELSPEELRFRKMAQWTQFLSIRQLNDLLVRGEVEPDAVAQIKHNRFAMTINNMILLVLGITFFMNRLPANVLTQAAKALVVCACAVLIIFIGQRLVGASGVFDPALPAWMPIFLFGPVAVVLLEKVKT
jgi:lipopolysaccharide export LptBFGC system permease protein LptF